MRRDIGVQLAAEHARSGKLGFRAFAFERTIATSSRESFGTGLREMGAIACALARPDADFFNRDCFERGVRQPEMNELRIRAEHDFSANI